MMNDKDREPVIHLTAKVSDTVELGDWSVVHQNVVLDGDIKIGRAAWVLNDAMIGGGQKELGSLRAGDFLHMGIRSFINIADFVTIGNEVGLGMETKIFTHGAYLNELDGFPFTRGPVYIGDETWLPYATVLPSTRIGDHVVVSAMSLVNRDLPRGCLAGGIPARVLKQNAYPQKIDKWIFLERIIRDVNFYGIDSGISRQDDALKIGTTFFYPLSRHIVGPVTKDTERVKDIFRRHGVRFRYYDNGGEYREWD